MFWLNTVWPLVLCALSWRFCPPHSASADITKEMNVLWNTKDTL